MANLTGYALAEQLVADNPALAHSSGADEKAAAQKIADHTGWSYDASLQALRTACNAAAARGELAHTHECPDCEKQFSCAKIDCCVSKYKRCPPCEGDHKRFAQADALRTYYASER